MAGKLLLIGTPIGNLGDLSARAIEAMKSCSLLLCEDTRHTRKLLTHFGIEVRVQSFHEHNEEHKSDQMLDRVQFGETVGLVSDAGMPLLSDPGYLLVQRARERKIAVEPIPGPFAAALALVASGLPPIPFAFFGFAPHKQGERVAFFQRVGAAEMTAVVYESPQRLVTSLEDALVVLGDVDVTVAREMTKLHEQFLHGTLSEILPVLRKQEMIRGEITVVFGAGKREAPILDSAAVRSEFERLRESGLRRPDVVKILSERYGIRKNELYQMLLQEE